MGKAPGLSISQMRELAKTGAIFELTYLSILPGKSSSNDSGRLTIEDMVHAINQAGARHFIISSDLGQVGNPLPPDGMKTFVTNLIQKGISVADIRLMIKTNPAKLLGID